MKVRVKRSSATGWHHAPPSNSLTHRAIVCGMLAEGKTHIPNPLICDDTKATIDAARLLGARIHLNGHLSIEGLGNSAPSSGIIYCGSSGTTFRLFVGLASLADGVSLLLGDPSLHQRPISDLVRSLNDWGANIHSVNGDALPPIEVRGDGLEGGSTLIRGDISSQFISSLLMAGSKARNECEVVLTSRLESKPYVLMTLKLMRMFGAYVHHSSDRFIIPGSQRYHAQTIHIEGDHSSAAFLEAFGALTGSVGVIGLHEASVQGDSKFVRLLREMGASVECYQKGVIVRKRPLQGITVDVSDIPDLVPILAVVASQADGTTVLKNVRRLKLKESDRIQTTISELSKMNVDIAHEQDSLRIEGPTRLHGASVNPHNDHRIAMAAFVAGTVAEGTTTIDCFECSTKSYPSFMRDMLTLGARATLIQRSGYAS